jgi:ABC-type uncharacterized transport system permease subunit
MYPAFMQKAAALTPFHAMLFAPASLVLGPGLVRPLVLARDLAIWGGVMAAVLRWTYRRAAAALTINGG